MNNKLELTSFEHLDLRLAMLVSNQNRLSGSLEILRPPDSNQDFRSHVETSHRIIVEIQRLFESSFEQPWSSKDTDLNGPGQQLKDLGWMEELQTALNKAAVLADSLRQLPSVSWQQFESFGFFLCHWVASFRESDRYASTWWRQQHENRIRPLRGYLQSVVDDLSLQAQLEEVVGQLLYVLSLIRYSQQSLENCQDRQQLILMMVRCNECAQGVLAQMEDLRQAARASRTDLREALSWSSCALKLDIRRVLKSDLHHLDAEVNSNTCYDRLDRAIGILLNGFDHTVRHLLNSFDPTFDGDGLLGDLQEQYRKACLLRKGLQSLRVAVEGVEKSPSGNALSSLQQAIQGFTGQAFTSLYRRDRRVIEEFSHDVDASDPQEMAFKAHQFQTFLATLLGEVRNRNVFSQFEQPSFVS